MARLAKYISALLLLLFATDTPTRAAELAISYSAAADFMPAFVAQDTGIFAKHGLDVKLSNLATTSLGPPALQAGSLQIAALSPALILLANDGGLDLVAIANVSYLTKKQPISSLVTRPGLAVTTAQGLVGKKIARPGINSAFDLMLKKWLLDGGVTLDRVTLIETPFPQMGDLLKAGQIDAAVIIEPILSRVVNSGAGIRSVDFVSEVNPRVVGAVWGATRAWTTANLPTVRQFQASLADGLTYIHDHPTESATIEKKYLGYAVPPPELALKLEPADFDFWINLEKQLKLLQQPRVDAASLIVQ